MTMTGTYVERLESDVERLEEAITSLMFKRAILREVSATKDRVFSNARDALSRLDEATTTAIEADVPVGQERYSREVAAEMKCNAIEIAHQEQQEAIASWKVDKSEASQDWKRAKAEFGEAVP